MTNEELQAKVDASPALRDMRDQLAISVGQKLPQDKCDFSILIAIALISLMVQVLNYCRERKKDEIKRDARDIRSLPPRKLMRLTRRANKLWREYQREHDMAPTTGPNPFLTSLYELAENGSDAALDELIDMANA